MLLLCSYSVNEVAPGSKLARPCQTESNYETKVSRVSNNALQCGPKYALHCVLALLLLWFYSANEVAPGSRNARPCQTEEQKCQTIITGAIIFGRLFDTLAYCSCWDIAAANEVAPGIRLALAKQRSKSVKGFKQCNAMSKSANEQMRWHQAASWLALDKQRSKSVKSFKQCIAMSK